MQNDWKPLDENRIEEIRKNIGEQQQHRLQSHRELLIHCRLFTETKMRVFQWNGEFPLWYFICLDIERLLLRSFYAKAAASRSVIDAGGFIGVFAQDFPQRASCVTSRGWRKQVMISPFHDFSSLHAVSIVLIRIPRSMRLHWYKQRFSNEFIQQIHALCPRDTIDRNDDKGTEDEKLDRLMTRDALRSQSNKQNALDRSYLLGVRNDGMHHPSVLAMTRDGRQCKRISTKFPPGWLLRDFLKLEHVSSQISDEILKQLHIYQVENELTKVVTEYLLAADLRLYQNDSDRVLPSSHSPSMHHDKPMPVAMASK